MFPLRAAQHRHPLRHVSGPTVSDYYGMIGLPSLNARRTAFLWLYGPTPHSRGGGRASRVPDASLPACHALGPRQSLGDLASCDPSVLASEYVKTVANCSDSTNGAVLLWGGTAPRRPAGFPVYASTASFGSVHLLHNLPDSCNTRYGWVVNPFPEGTLTPQETPSFAWRTSGLRITC